MNETLKQIIAEHIEFIYDGKNLELIDEILELLPDDASVIDAHNKWSEKDILVITYADSVKALTEKPLITLKSFFDSYLKEEVNMVHILPFFPYSSDDGFAVIDYEQVKNEFGGWNEINQLGADYDLMFDLVINHTSSESKWFQGFLKDESQYKNFYIEIGDDFDISNVIRPRATPLLAEFETENGTKKVWATFSHDQLDVNFANVRVLIEFIKILILYLENKARLVRLDAVGFLWKESGSTCMHHEKTHRIIRLLRNIAEAFQPETIIVTETNVPNQENLSYFGNRNEAHMIYNFSLPPLILHALLTGVGSSLKSWLMSMPPAPQGCVFLNFIASHDGIGLRPLEGLVTDADTASMVKTLTEFGARINMRKLANGDEKPYEINISLFDALKGTIEGPDQWQVERFLCAHIFMLGLEGIPAFYIHSLMGTESDFEAVKAEGHNRAINRHKWNYENLEAALGDKQSHHSQILTSLKKLLQVRKQQPAFHPNATQFTLHLHGGLFAFWRQSIDRHQSIFCIHNLTNKPEQLSLADLNLVVTDQWLDLISGTRFESNHEHVDLKPYQCMWITNRF